jgi:hypothetical protein
MQADGQLPADTKLRSSKYLNNLIEQDHRGVKLRIGPMLGFKQFTTAAITIAGIKLGVLAPNIPKVPLRNPSAFKGLREGAVTGAKRRARADFSLAPTRGDSIQALCGRRARHRWSAAGAEAVFVDAAGRER